MGYVVPGVDLLVAAIAAATILVLADVAVLAPSRPLKRAWWGLSVMLGGCVALLLVHAVFNLGRRPGMGDLVGVAISSWACASSTASPGCPAAPRATCCACRTWRATPTAIR